MLDIIFTIFLFAAIVLFSCQTKAALDESRYWRHMTALYIRPTLDRKDFGLPEDDD